MELDRQSETELNKLQEQYDDPIETELATAKK